MSERDDERNEVEPVSDKELGVIRDAITTKYGAHLRPGESLSVDAERTAEHAFVSITVEAPDDSFYLEFEGASRATDDEEKWVPGESLDLVLDLVDAQLDEYFRNDRFAKLHDDWRVYEFRGTNLRFRGIERRPELERLADAWLEAGGDPDATDSSTDASTGNDLN